MILQYSFGGGIFFTNFHYNEEKINELNNHDKATKYYVEYAKTNKLGLIL